MQFKTATLIQDMQYTHYKAAWSTPPQTHMQPDTHTPSPTDSQQHLDRVGGTGLYFPEALE